MKDDDYKRIVHIINSTEGTKIFPDRECFRAIKEAYPDISDYTMGSIYSAEYMRRMKQNHFKISKCPEALHNRYKAAVEEDQPDGILLRMSDEIDLSPALLARLIVKYRYEKELEGSSEVSTSQTLDSNSAEGQVIELSKVPSTINSEKEIIKDDSASNLNEKSVLVVSEAPPNIASLLVTIKNTIINETEVDISNIHASHSAEEAKSIISEAPHINDSVTKPAENATLTETKDGIVNTPVLNFVEEAVSIVLPVKDSETGLGKPVLAVSNAPPNKGSLVDIVDTVKNAKCNETEIKKTDIPASKVADEAKMIISEAPHINDPVTQTVENAAPVETKDGIANNPGLDFVKADSVLGKALPIKDSETELINSPLIETNVNITNTPASNLAKNETESTQDKSDENKVNNDQGLAVIEDPPRKITITTLMRDPKLIEDPQLANEAYLCILHDDQYGPIADCLKHLLGQEYEMRLLRLGRAAGLIFNNECALRTTGFDKTPDIKLEVPIVVDGFVVNWIESKAVFGDLETHREYIKEQYECYWNRFGSGMVIYWFGFQERLDRLHQEHMLIAEDFPKDFTIPYMGPKKYKINHNCVPSL